MTHNEDGQAGEVQPILLADKEQKVVSLHYTLTKHAPYLPAHCQDNESLSQVKMQMKNILRENVGNYLFHTYIAHNLTDALHCL